MYSGAYKQIPSIKLSVCAVFAKLTMLCILVFSDEIFGTIYYCGSNTKYVNNNVKSARRSIFLRNGDCC